MKLQKALILLLAVCLAGCSFGGIAPDATDPHGETTLPTAAETAAPTGDPTVPPQVIPQPEPDDKDLVKVTAYIPDIVVDLRYATDNNFTKQKIYDFTDVWLRYGTVKKLMPVQKALRQRGLSLKIWDGFRPPAAQFKLWEVYPDPTYVYDPNKGFSGHSRGNTVDVSLVYADGTEVVMPTDFDDFSRLADRNYSDCTEEAADNALLLENLMKQHGFNPYSGEWWHFSDTQSYPVEEIFTPIRATLCHADHSITLRTSPVMTADAITEILPGVQFRVVAKYNDFALIEYNGLWGYGQYSDIPPVE